MIPDGVKVQLTDFKSVLSVEEHNFLVKKLIAQFEMNVAALSADAARSTSLGESWVRFCFLYVSGQHEICIIWFSKCEQLAP